MKMGRKNMGGRKRRKRKEKKRKEKKRKERKKEPKFDSIRTGTRVGVGRKGSNAGTYRTK
jgi:hypothetical protein